MRITSGKYKGRTLKAPKGKTTRPILSRLRQALLDRLRPWIEGGAVLDLFCGSGGLLFEALSRGARSGVAIDLDGRAVATIKANLAALRVEEPVEVHRQDALLAIGQLAARGLRFDVILVAPPYWKGLQARALEALDRAPALLAEDGIVCVQRDRKEDAPAAPLASLSLEDERTHGHTVIAYYRPRTREEPGIS